MVSRSERLFRPKSIAVFGGSVGEEVIRQCQQMGFDGDIWPVHPTRNEVLGLRCFSDVSELPKAPDAAFVGVNRRLTLDIIADLAKMGAGGAVCYASGFSEAVKDFPDGEDMQRALVDTAGDMPFLGPNCYGFINYLDGALLWPDQHGGKRVEKGVAILTQSSNIALNMTMQQRGLPISYLMTLGNQAGFSQLETAYALLDDERVTAIGLHIEAVNDLQSLESLAIKARAKNIPVICMVMGKSEQAQAAVLSHTASMTGRYDMGQAVMQRLGFGLVDDPSLFLETLKLLHFYGPLPGRDICSMSCSGGEAALMADLGRDESVNFRPLTASQELVVKEALPEMVVPANPLDYHTFIWGDGIRSEQAFAAMIGCDFDLSLLIIDFPRIDRCQDDAWSTTIDALVAARDQTGNHTACVASLKENMPESWINIIEDKGIACFSDLKTCLKAVSISADIGENWQKPMSAPLLTASSLSESEKIFFLDESTAKQDLGKFGLPVPENALVSDVDMAVKWAANHRGAVVLKALDVAHKSDVGALKLGLSSADDIVAAYRDLEQHSDRLMIETMVDNCIVEMIVGVQRDPVYGFAMVVGAGGIFVEIMKDTRLLPLPTNKAAIYEAIQSLQCYPLLAGARGKQVADIEALVDTMMMLSDYVEKQKNRITTIDLNPVMVLPKNQGVVIADALIGIRPETSSI